MLLLDEALSEVDPETIRRVVAGVDAGQRRTRLVVTHGADEAHGPFDIVLDLSRRPAWAR